MPLFSWAKPTPLSIEKNISAQKRIYFISDLHLGDGSRSDTFMAKDADLMKLIEQIRIEKAHLVIVGDAIDFHQAWTINRVIKAHARLMRSLSELAEDSGVTYIWGNHDQDISLFRDLLQFDVCSELTLDEKVLVRHGYEYDPYIGPNLEQSHVSTRIHHMFERVFDTWIRLPLENFYTFENRLIFWFFHKYALFLNFMNWFWTKTGSQERIEKNKLKIRYWTRAQIVDPACIFENVREASTSGKNEYVLTGHSHLPGIVKIGEGKTYVNTGSWTFNSSQYAVWDGKKFSVHDWLSGKKYSDEAYALLMERNFLHMDFFSWWRENYMGWLRFRVGEQGRTRQPKNIRITDEERAAISREMVNQIPAIDTTQGDNSGRKISCLKPKRIKIRTRAREKRKTSPLKKLREKNLNRKTETISRNQQRENSKRIRRVRKNKT